jgi:hypothetical protein
MVGCRSLSARRNPGRIGRRRLTVYSELMKVALATDDRQSDSLADVVRDALSYRVALAEGEGSAARIGDALTYDVTLARLCERLQIDHDLAGETAGREARLRAEDMIAARLPLLAAELAGERRG